MAKADPPQFFDDPSEYADYKFNLQRWGHVTKTDKKLQAEVVLYQLAGHHSGIQQKIDTALGQDIKTRKMVWRR